MRKLLLLLSLLLPGSAAAQSVRFQSQAISTRGAGIANATVAVCTQPAVTNTQPCSPLATLATSTSTTSGGANPLTADSFGNFFFYAAPGRYTVQIYGPAVSGQFVTPDVEVGSVAGGSSGIFSNLTVSGTGTLTNAGVFTNTQMNEYQTSSINSCNFQTEFQAAQSGFATDAIAGCMKVSSGATVQNSEALAGYAENSSTGSNVAGLYTTSRCLVSASSCWGANPLVECESGATTANCLGLEVDVNNKTGVDATQSQTNRMDGIFTICGAINRCRFGLQVISVSFPFDGWQTAATFSNYKTQGVQIGGVNSSTAGSVALNIIPPDNTNTNEVTGRNAANTSSVWTIQNSGNATFPLVNTPTIQNGVGTQLTVPSTGTFIPATTNPFLSTTAPTIAAAGCGGAAAAIVSPNGTAAFKINVGTTPGSACTITMPAATTGWNVTCVDITTNSTSVFLQKQTGVESTTSVTITNFNDVAVATAFAANDILKCTAMAD